MAGEGRVQINLIFPSFIPFLSWSLFHFFRNLHPSYSFYSVSLHQMKTSFLTPFVHSFIHLLSLSYSFTSPYCFKSPLLVQIIFIALPMSQKRSKLLWDLPCTLAMEPWIYLCVTVVDTFIERIRYNFYFWLQMLLNFLHKGWGGGRGHAVVQLVEALRYKPEGRGFNSKLCHWNFSLT
jgi:hypothetical protein